MTRKDTVSSWKESRCGGSLIFRIFYKLIEKLGRYCRRILTLGLRLKDNKWMNNGKKN